MSEQKLPAQLDDQSPPPPPEGEHSDVREPPPSQPRARRGGNGIAWLALLAALGAIGWNAHQYLEHNRRAQGERALLNEQARRLGELERKLALADSELAGRARALEERQRALDEALAGVRTLAGLRARNGWVVAEAEYLVRLAVEMLRIRDDAGTAIAMLKDADQRLAELGDPELHTARTLLAADIAALKGLPPAPLSGLSAALTRLMEQVEQLPLPIRHAPPGAPPGTPTPPDDRWQWRAWLDEAEAWFRRSVTLRRDGDAPEPLIAPGEHYFLTQNLRLTLATARLALYRDDPAGFHSALAEARRWITTHFDGTATLTRGVLRELAHLEQAPLTRPLPPLTESLDALIAAGTAAEGKQP